MEGTANILLVNDRPEQLLALESVLADLKQNIVTANSGREALRCLLKDEFAVILLDVNMPGMDGFDTAELIRQRPRTAHVPIIFVTALSGGTNSVSRGYALRAVDYIFTPIVPEVLKAKVGVFVELFRKTEQVKRQVEELRQAEAALAAHQQQIEEERATLAAVMASMNDGLLVFGPSREVRYFNTRAGQLLGMDSDDLLDGDANLALASAGRTEDSDAIRQAWQQVEEDPASLPSCELRIEGIQPRDLVLQFFAVRGENDTKLGVGAVIRDVTAERDLERTKDEIISVVSHELRTPLASIVGFADLLLTREYPEASKREFLSIMVEEGLRLTALINDFLDLQRMESGRISLHVQPEEVEPLLARGAASCGEDSERPILLDLPRDLSLVRADTDAIQQVLANLLSNARKYSPAGGGIHLSARALDHEVQISVTDHGLGLPPDALPRLFQKFYRVEDADRRTIKGTGLGLAICQKIIVGHGGRIWAESAGVGQGSTFSFTLPLAEQEGASRGQVLIVEDESNFARLLQVELSARGLTSNCVTTAEAALELVAAARPQAVMLDLMLPGLQGEAFLGRLAETGAFGVPVVVVSVKQPNKQERQLLRRKGVVALFRKGPKVAASAADAIVAAVQKYSTGAQAG